MQSALNLLQPGEEALVLNASHTMNAGGEEQVASVLRAVLDANVFVSAAVHPEGPPGRIIERFLRTDTFTIALSPGIVEEVLRALAYPKGPPVPPTRPGSCAAFEDLIVLAELVPGAYPLVLA